MRELNTVEIENVDGGIIPAIYAAYFAAQYVTMRIRARRSQRASALRLDSLRLLLQRKIEGWQMNSNTAIHNAPFELSAEQVEQVSGGILPVIIPIAIAFGKGFAAGAAVAGGVLLVADALDIEL